MHLCMNTGIFAVPPAINIVSLSSEKKKSLWIKASAKCPQCKNINVKNVHCHSSFDNSLRELLIKCNLNKTERAFKNGWQTFRQMCLDGKMVEG